MATSELQYSDTRLSFTKQALYLLSVSILYPPVLIYLHLGRITISRYLSAAHALPLSDLGITSSHSLFSSLSSC
ncbi:uncharacterized [Tachysurus ichikawai]